MALTQEQLTLIKAEAERFKELSAELSRVSVEMWQTRIDMVIAAGAAETVDDIITPPSPFWGDTNCSCAARQLPGMEP